MSLYYKSTRGDSEKVNSLEAIVKGIANDGGLYVPSYIEKIDMSLNELSKMNYQELAYYIINKFFPDFSEEELKDCVNSAYDEKFDTKEIAPIVEKSGAYFLELFHGPTLAFKDMALSILPYLLKTSATKLDYLKEIVILTATSGDTGKAALEGFKDVDGIKIIVYYPENGVSEVQERQMITQEGKNTYVVGIKGNFDDAQSGVKEAFNNREFNLDLDSEGYVLSSANSINIGRLVPQVVYYFHGYIELLRSGKIKEGDKINVVVPTGNFGNILAAFYAKKMGLPINRFICASNENNVLSDFFKDGVYDRRRELKLTNSPSMDILISSNLERLLYELSGEDDENLKELMDKLSQDGIYEVSDRIKVGLKDFYGNFATEEETHSAISKVYKGTDYVMDTHTAVAYSVYEKYKDETGDNTPTIIDSTASPFKFTRSVSDSLGIEIEGKNDFELIKELSNKTGLIIPNSIKDLETREILHKTVCNKDEIKEAIKKY
ncbi:threonine synthase ThrC [Gottschalkia acidurici 9a]|uniref:Threonine synthase n=1 Tax=Gottschalkia acidurici (strain ATCC 7906 / DSM 604 / BCRC 14475 / CIP 104303 / KCTC 5404 / NCIMB 10678 / 9a) TaxID=1128398 RepID=K0AWP1_GOTA9|nr:threonine synthase [Gottschalkia acidurici]AFS77150.1 threonine synthase ThrC [Gottschalkia acidurici 9a]